jgi:acetyl esterase/lipase
MKPVFGTLIFLGCFSGFLHAEESKVSEVVVKKDIPYRDPTPGQEKKNLLDLYLPKAEKPFSTVVFVHGGSWKSGDKALYGALGALLAKQGIGIAIINYRLTTGDKPAKHPEHIQDVAKAFGWVEKHIGEYGGVKEKLFICGHSAGGHLVSLLATDETYLKAEGLTKSAIRGVLSLSGVYQIVPNFPLFSRVFGSDETTCTSASPISHVKDKLPPFLILYAENDLPTLGSMAENMAKALNKVASSCELHMLTDRNHITIIMKPALDAADPGLKYMVDFISKYSK